MIKEVIFLSPLSKKMQTSTIAALLLLSAGGPGLMSTVSADEIPEEPVKGPVEESQETVSEAPETPVENEPLEPTDTPANSEEKTSEAEETEIVNGTDEDNVDPAVEEEKEEESFVLYAGTTIRDMIAKKNVTDVVFGHTADYAEEIGDIEGENLS